MTAYLGIDPGLSGGLAVVDETGAVMAVWSMPLVSKVLNIRLLKTLVEVKGAAHAVLEQVSAMPGQGVTSMFAFGRVYGACEAAIVAAGIPYTLVRPQAWQKVMHQGVTKGEGPKGRSLIAAQRLFPGQSFLASPRSKKPHDGMIDAALLAEYCRRTYGTK